MFGTLLLMRDGDVCGSWVDVEVTVLGALGLVVRLVHRIDNVVAIPGSLQGAHGGPFVLVVKLRRITAQSGKVFDVSDELRRVLGLCSSIACAAFEGGVALVVARAQDLLH